MQIADPEGNRNKQELEEDFWNKFKTKYSGCVYVFLFAHKWKSWFLSLVSFARYNEIIL